MKKPSLGTYARMIWSIAEFFSVKQKPATSRKDRFTYIKGERITYDLMTGDTVKHPEHGRGTVISIRGGLIRVRWYKPIRQEGKPQRLRTTLNFPNDLIRIS